MSPLVTPCGIQVRATVACGGCTGRGVSRRDSKGGCRGFQGSTCAGTCLGLRPLLYLDGLLGGCNCGSCLQLLLLLPQVQVIASTSQVQAIALTG